MLATPAPWQIFDEALKGTLPQVDAAIGDCERQLALVHTLFARKYGCETERNKELLTGPTERTLERVAMNARAIVAPPLWASQGPPSGHVL